MPGLNVYYDQAYTGSAFAFDTTRKAAWVADSLAADPIAGIRLVAPESSRWDQVAQVHAPAYVQAIRTGEPRDLAQSQKLRWDAGLGPMVLATNGGAVASALDALRSGVSGSLSSGLHHARRACGKGYCTFNGLVMAAHAALDAGAGSVLILDLDAHCGGGTAELSLPVRIKDYLDDETPRSPGWSEVAKIRPVLREQPRSVGAVLEIARTGRHVGYDGRGARFPELPAHWLSDGDVVAAAGIMNPQIRFGEDG